MGVGVKFSRNSYWWKKTAQHKLARLSGGRIVALESYKHGILDVEDIARASGEISTIIDVGANVGQSAIRFRSVFPNARIISLEPISPTFDKLIKNTAGLGIECHLLALGPANEHATMYLTSFSETNSLVPPVEEDKLGTQEVEVQRLDYFLHQEKIDTVDLLKIDAEGFDFEVLKGGVEALGQGRIRFVMIEVSFHPGDDRHPTFDDIRSMLTPYGFKFFGLYGQTLEWTGDPAQRFANAIFCRQDSKTSNGQT